MFYFSVAATLTSWTGSQLRPLGRTATAPKRAGSPNSNQSSPEKAKPKAKPVAAEKPKPKPAAKQNKEAWESSGDEDNIIDEDTDEDEEFSLVTILKLLLFKKIFYELFHFFNL